MPQELPFFPLALLVAASLPAACCLHLPSSPSDLGKSHHRQYHWAYHKVNDDDDRGDKQIDSDSWRYALLQLLDLNDGELQALLSGVSPRKVAPHLEPSTAFLLASSRQYLEKLNTVLSIVEESSPAKKSTWNPRIARRHKKTRRNHKDLESNPSDSEDPDSILGALTELSEYLSGAENEDEEYSRQQERRRRSHHPGGSHKHQQVTSKHGSSRFETRHYIYYLQSRECPSGYDGSRKRYCPTPYDTGKPECIDDMELCDGIPQCPNEEDEAPTHCLFYGALKTHIDALEKAVLEEKFASGKYR